MTVTTSGMENFFKELSLPAQSLGLPTLSKERPPAVFFENMIKRAEELGITWIPDF